MTSKAAQPEPVTVVLSPEPPEPTPGVAQALLLRAASRLKEGRERARGALLAAAILTEALAEPLPAIRAARLTPTRSL